MTHFNFAPFELYLSDAHVLCSRECDPVLVYKMHNL